MPKNGFIKLYVIGQRKKGMMDDFTSEWVNQISKHFIKKCWIKLCLFSFQFARILQHTHNHGTRCYSKWEMLLTSQCRSAKWFHYKAAFVHSIENRLSRTKKKKKNINEEISASCHTCMNECCSCSNYGSKERLKGELCKHTVMCSDALWRSGKHPFFHFHSVDSLLVCIPGCRLSFISIRRFQLRLTSILLTCSQ